ncbi:MAG TPA: hypothetical protein VIY73_05820, partial [Polyangiaceae bacterium]
MICTTCGRDNPSHLTFCQECGQRLAPRVASPTPPIGLGGPPNEPAASPLAATALAPSTPPPPPVPANVPAMPPMVPAPVPSARASGGFVPQRPPAPPVSFAPRGEGSPAPSLVVAGAPAPTTAMIACPLCGSANPRGLRFCVTCGHLLEQAGQGGQAAQALQPPPAGSAGRGPTGTADLSRTVPDQPPRFSSAPPPPTPTPPPIAPVRVVDVGQAPAPAMQRLCSRCRGASDGLAQFCRFCGASLADAQAVPIQPSANPIAGSPPPAPAPPPVAARAPV